METIDLDQCPPMRYFDDPGTQHRPGRRRISGVAVSSRTHARLRKLPPQFRPFLPQRVQVKLGSMSESRMLSAQASALYVMRAAVIAAVDQDVADTRARKYAKSA